MRDLTAFNHRLATTFGADHRMWYDEVAGRYAHESLSAGGKPVIQYWCEFRGTEPHPETGLHPYRDLDESAQEEIIRNLQKSYIGKTGFGLQDWSLDFAARRLHNDRLKAANRKSRAAKFADMLTEVRGTTVKHHSGSRTARRIARG